MTTVKAEVSAKLMNSLKRVLRKHLAPTKVADVKVEGTVDWEGEPLLTVYVFLRQQVGRFELPHSERYFAMWKHVHSTLERAGDARRPLLRFLSEEDMSNVRV